MAGVHWGNGFSSNFYQLMLARASSKPFGSKGASKPLGSLWKTSRHVQSGHWVSELYPHVAGHEDQLCMLHAMHTDQ